ncbi:Nif3-like dinuclear metal center hexameric protein [Clostridium omnivorum]|uniref:GTP cyclohydrolase 1 type 2 homolog n=1 Tax=Clostridium omnivorum TaxID=1604902 RepID=A0ABQ5NAH4_9CLOT|nr:Nif3-like dinuclear metal center hexameric protein [Clostridium sp. E14]GLC32265.1 GTP cyclohydrolase 1 type 2 [Clostridium sp. E14]
MSLKVKDFRAIIEKYAPKELKEDYDNVGLMVGDPESIITSILIALDCTFEVIDEAIERQCNLIFTHHPLLFIKPNSITTETLQGEKIIKLIKSDINLYSSHTNLDVAENGLNDLVTRILGYDEWEIIEPYHSKNIHDDSLGIGRLVTLKEPVFLSEMCNKVKNSLGIKVLRYSGEEEMSIEKVAIINGSGEDYFESAKNMGAQCIITGDTTYHFVSDFNEQNIAIIDAGHFPTEWAPMKLLADIIKKEIINLGEDVPIIVSDKSKNPYKYK